MRRVDRRRLEKRRQSVITAGLSFALGALAAGTLIWRVDQLPPLPTTEVRLPSAEPADGPPVGAGDPPPGVATSGSEDGADPIELLRSRRLSMPVDGVSRDALRDSFDERRSGGLRRHDAIDIMAARGTPVRAVDEGRVAKLFTSIPGGLTVYLFDAREQFSYYYAHLDRYAPGLHEGQQVRPGDLIGHVGSTGNASEDAPHLHFAIFRLPANPRWSEGDPVNPYPVLR